MDRPETCRKRAAECLVLAKQATTGAGVDRFEVHVDATDCDPLGAREPAVADDVGDQNRSDPARWRCARQLD